MSRAKRIILRREVLKTHIVSRYGTYQEFLDAHPEVNIKLDTFTKYVSGYTDSRRLTSLIGAILVREWDMSDQRDHIEVLKRQLTESA